MSEKYLSLRILLDEGTPVGIADPFRARGIRVYHHRDLLAPGASDDEVVSAAIHESVVLVAVDLDMKRYGKRFGKPDAGRRHPDLDLIFMSCRPNFHKSRTEQALDLIALEWRFRCEKPSRRLWVDIADHRISTYR